VATIPPGPDILAKLREEVAGWCTIEKELGGGGMSRVFIGLDLRLQRRIVIKTLLPLLTATLSAERFRREIMLSASLQHPNIVPVLSSGDVAGQPYFVMPFIEGESLRARLKRGPLSVRETVSILHDVANALAFAHERGIVHRDIKPDNILLSAGAAVVTDFGVAKAITDARAPRAPVVRAPVSDPMASLTAAGISLGTPAYMAPEQVAADPTVDARADLYALGIVAFEMLAGAPPFVGSSQRAVFAAHLSVAPPNIRSRRSDVPVALGELIMKSLAKAPEDRPRSAKDVARELDQPEMVSGAFDAPSDSKRGWIPRVLVGLGVAAILAATIYGPQWLASRTVAAPVPIATTAPTPPVARRVGVVPFVGAGGDQAATRIAEGLTVNVEGALGSVPDVQVISRARTQPAGVSAVDSAAGFRGVLLYGNVQRERSGVRVVIRAVEGDSLLWTSTVRGHSDSVFALQDSVVQAVVRGMRSRR
jgi:eukaryotic-like serine/threonine-protein kinase